MSSKFSFLRNKTETTYIVTFVYQESYSFDKIEIEKLDI